MAAAPQPGFRREDRDFGKLAAVTEDFMRNTYMDQIQEVCDRTRTAIKIDLNHADEDLARRIVTNTPRFLSDFIPGAVDKILKDLTPTGDRPQDRDVLEVLMEQRRAYEDRDPASARAGDEQNGMPPALTRRYELLVEPPAKMANKPLAVRAVKASKIGQLVTVRGIVTRVTDVKPMITVASYTCEQCGYESYQPVVNKTFMPLQQCPAPMCVTNRMNGRIHLQTRASKMVKYQEIKVQEQQDQVPMGQIPRSITIQAWGELTRQCKPGDEICVSGMFLPTPFTGFRGSMQAGRQLIADTFIKATHIHQKKKCYENLELSQEMLDRIEDFREQENTYQKLALSIAPEIYGHEDVKKALLLMLVGGSGRNLGEGVKIRGDVHMCMMGDPGVAKSQLLKSITKVAPRAVYTTGKGSSGVGLTAAVIRDPNTQEFVLEGGALVLADKGICCIDEFDKMEESDRTAIHEVMEQQTVSIAKGGITTQLNARTAVLAAANPAYGRYNLRRSPSENINMPAALLSRFDLMFLMLDLVDEDNDLELARHVGYVHQHNKQPPTEHDPLDAPFIRAYVSQCRKFTPFIPEELTQHIVNAYVSKRAEDLGDSSTGGGAGGAVHGSVTYTTARTLLSILRLSQALARLRFDTEVIQGDVDEAVRLMEASTRSLSDCAREKVEVDPVSAIFSVIVHHMRARNIKEVRISDMSPIVTAKYSTEQFEQCIDTYVELNVWMSYRGKLVMTSEADEF